MKLRLIVEIDVVLEEMTEFTTYDFLEDARAFALRYDWVTDATPMLACP